MSLYIVSFDLFTPNGDNRSDDYQIIEDFFRNSFDNYVKPLYNIYLVSSTQYNAVSIREKIRFITSSVDNIFVARLEGEYASWNYSNINKEIELIFKMRKGE